MMTDEDERSKKKEKEEIIFDISLINSSGSVKQHVILSN
jgi:hypothetical protein